MPGKENELNIGPVIKDFDKLAPQQRQARLGGRVIDVTTIPARVLLQAAKFSDEQAGYSDLDRITKALDIVAKITQLRDPEITADWLLDHADLNQLVAFIHFCLSPVRAAQEKEGEAVAPESSG